MTVANDLSNQQFVAAQVLSKWPDQDDASAGLHLIEIRNRYAVAIARALVEDTGCDTDLFAAADQLVQQITCECADEPVSNLAFLRAVAAGER